jgi:hypothetical protein
MAKNKKRDQFDTIKEVKAMARERIGTPPTSRVVPDRKKKKKATEKHKSTLGEMLDDV